MAAAGPIFSCRRRNQLLPCNSGDPQENNISAANDDSSKNNKSHLLFDYFKLDDRTWINPLKEYKEKIKTDCRFEEIQQKEYQRRRNKKLQQYIMSESGVDKPAKPPPKKQEGGGAKKIGATAQIYNAVRNAAAASATGGAAKPRRSAAAASGISNISITDVNICDFLELMESMALVGTSAARFNFHSWLKDERDRKSAAEKKELAQKKSAPAEKSKKRKRNHANDNNAASANVNGDTAPPPSNAREIFSQYAQKKYSAVIQECALQCMVKPVFNLKEALDVANNHFSSIPTTVSQTIPLVAQMKRLTKIFSELTKSHYVRVTNMFDQQGMQCIISDQPPRGDNTLVMFQYSRFVSKAVPIPKDASGTICYKRNDIIMPCANIPEWKYKNEKEADGSKKSAVAAKNKSSPVEAPATHTPRDSYGYFYVSTKIDQLLFSLWWILYIDKIIANNARRWLELLHSRPGLMMKTLGRRSLGPREAARLYIQLHQTECEKIFVRLIEYNGIITKKIAEINKIVKTTKADF